MVGLYSLGAFLNSVFPWLSPLPFACAFILKCIHTVNNVSYFRYQETSRLCHFNKMVDLLRPEHKVLGVEFVTATGVGPILADTSIRYKFPLKFPDTVLVGANILPSDISEKHTMIQTHAMWGLGPGRLVAEGQGKIVAFDYRTGRKALQFPNPVMDAFCALSSENSTFMMDQLISEFKL